jgi:hypothetical protein
MLSLSLTRGMPDVPVGIWRLGGQTEQDMKVQDQITLYQFHNFQDHC